MRFFIADMKNGGVSCAILSNYIMLNFIRPCCNLASAGLHLHQGPAVLIISVHTINTNKI